MHRSTLLLRLAIALAFLYPPFDAISNPNAWLGFFPPAMLQFASAHGISGMTLLMLWSVVEVVIAAWVLSGKRIFLPSAAATLFLILIVVFNIPLMEIVFRDIALALVSATLAWWSYRTPRTTLD